jgi:hypothetical protein
VTSREVEWTPDQQALILALDLMRQLACNECGGYLPETTDPANERFYEPAGPFLCYSCEALGRTRAQVAKRREETHTPIYNMSRWSVRLRKG